jgi:hypothetical protein
MSDENRGWKPAEELPSDDRLVFALCRNTDDSGVAWVFAYRMRMESGNLSWKFAAMQCWRGREIRHIRLNRV